MVLAAGCSLHLGLGDCRNKHKENMSREENVVDFTLLNVAKSVK